MWQATATPSWQNLCGGTKVIRYGYSDTLALASALPQEMHGHGVTLMPLGALLCVNAGGASQPGPGDGSMLSWRWDMVGVGVWLPQASHLYAFVGMDCNPKVQGVP